MSAVMLWPNSPAYNYCDKANRIYVPTVCTVIDHRTTDTR